MELKKRTVPVPVPVERPDGGYSCPDCGDKLRSPLIRGEAPDAPLRSFLCRPCWSPWVLDARDGTWSCP